MAEYSTLKQFLLTHNFLMQIGTDTPKSKKAERIVSVALGGTSCVFKREIKPLQRYEVWSRVLTWDAKWLVLVTYFVKAGTHKNVMRSLQKGEERTRTDRKLRWQYLLSV